MDLCKNKSKIFYYMLIAYTFFAFLSPLSSMFFVILCALMVGSVLWLDDDDMLCFLAFASCFMACFNIQTMFLKTLVAGMTIFIVKHLISAIKCKNKKKIYFISFILLFSLILFIYGLFVTNFRIYKITQSLSIIVMLATFFLIKKISIKNLTLSLSAGLIISSLCSIIAYVSGILPKQPFAFDSISSFRFSAYFNNVNALALYASLCQTCILTSILTNKLSIKKYFWLPIVITIIGLLTFSKTFTLVTALSYAIAITWGFAKSQNKKQYIKFFLVGALAVGIFVLLFHHYAEIIVDRFFHNDGYDGFLNSLTTGRLEIWKSYLHKWTSSPLYVLFGCGVTANNVNKRTAHSFALSLLYKFGIVGTIILIAITIYIFKNIKSHKNISYYFPLLIILTNGLVEDIACGLYTFLPLLIALCFVVKTKGTQN